MANGTKGDHPLTDILIHHLQVYGLEADELIRKIADLCSQRELYAWWERELGWSIDAGLALRKAREQHNALVARAKMSGWETEA
jgi:hypothetical protein